MAIALIVIMLLSVVIAGAFAIALVAIVAGAAMLRLWPLGRRARRD